MAWTKALTKNKKVLDFVNKSAELAEPDEIIWIDGSKKQIAALREEACKTGEMIKLNQEKLPDCYYHRTAENDVARVEARTFICCKNKEDAGPINYWMDPQEAYKLCGEIARGKMKGRKMYVIPYSMGVVGSPFSKIGIEVTDSIYVVLNMAIMTRVGKNVYKALGKDGDFVKGFHCKCDVDPEKRYIMHFPEDDTIISVNSAYGGNVLLGKKCFALRIASNLGRREGWMAEHMLILGVTYPDGKKKYLAAAFPSACGKTNLAMLIPPEHYLKKGYKVECVGDDIAWIRVGEDGRLWAVNPENGFVYQSRDWDHGVFVGSIMSSETTAAATGAVGVLRHDPMAMKPFAGYHMADYFSHWIDMGKKTKNPPKIFNVNWFRQDENGEFLWPGFGDNMRVLDWILKRCAGEVDAEETAIGYVPYAKDIDLEGLDMNEEDLKNILYIDKKRWSGEADEIAGYYEQFGDRLPAELKENLETLKKNCEE